MAYLNKVMLIGNLGKDPVVAASPTGRKRVSFSLATSRRYKDSNGETKEDTQWHNIVGWGKVADTIELLGIRKGHTLYIEGSLTNRSWTDQSSGQKRTLTEVSLDTFQLLTQKGTTTTAQESNPYSQGANANSYNQATQQAYDRQMQRTNSEPPVYENGQVPDDDGLPF